MLVHKSAAVVTLKAESAHPAMHLDQKQLFGSFVIGVCQTLVHTASHKLRPTKREWFADMKVDCSVFGMLHTFYQYRLC